jgi:hypothetical protein
MAAPIAAASMVASPSMTSASTAMTSACSAGRTSAPGRQPSSLRSSAAVRPGPRRPAALRWKAAASVRRRRAHGAPSSAVSAPPKTRRPATPMAGGLARAAPRTAATSSGWTTRHQRSGPTRSGTTSPLAAAVRRKARGSRRRAGAWPRRNVERMPHDDGGAGAARSAACSAIAGYAARSWSLLRYSSTNATSTRALSGLSSTVTDSRAAASRDSWPTPPVMKTTRAACAG